jgi:hypothetical protein
VIEAILRIHDTDASAIFSIPEEGGNASENIPTKPAIELTGSNPVWLNPARLTV